MLNVELPYDSTISLLVGYLSEIKHIFTQKLIQECSWQHIYNNQNVKTVQMFINWWMDKLNMVYHTIE